MTTRGIRNNNPGNIERKADKWQGMAADQSSDDRFVVFTSPTYGIRALAKVLLTYYLSYKLDTVRKIISRWAPGKENPTESYIAFVSERMSIEADALLDVDTMDVMLPLVKAIILEENAGQCPYTDAQITEALNAAGVSDAKPKPLVKKPTFLAQSGTAVATGCAGMASMAPHVKSVADQLNPYVAAPVIQRAVTALIAVAGGLTVLGIVAELLKARSAKW